MSELKQIFFRHIDAHQKQQDQSHYVTSEYTVKHENVTENSTSFPSTPTISPEIEAKGQRQRVVEKQQQSERIQVEETRDHPVPDGIFTDRQEKTNNSFAGGVSNTEPVQTAKAVSTYSQYSSTRSSNEDSYDEWIIYKAQQQLTVLGYSPGKIDGKIGRQTTKALMQFQKYNNLLVSGSLDSNTLTALSSASYQVSSALQKNNSGTTEKSTGGRIVKYLPASQVHRPETIHFGATAGADFKSSRTDTTPSFVNTHMNKPVNNQITQTKISTNFGEAQLQLPTEVQTNIFGYTSNTFGGNSFFNSNFVSQKGVVIPWGGFQGNLFGNYTANQTPLSNFVTATGSLPSMPSTSQMLYTIHHPH